MKRNILFLIISFLLGVGGFWLLDYFVSICHPASTPDDLVIFNTKSSIVLLSMFIGTWITDLLLKTPTEKTIV